MEKNSWLLGFDCQQETQLILKATKDFSLFERFSLGEQTEMTEVFNILK